MPFSFTWEMNPATLLAIGGAVLTGIRVWSQVRAMAADACKQAEIAKARAEDAHKSIAILQASISAYRETQAERLVSREILREVEERLTSSIERLGDRLDTFVKEIAASNRRRE
jgi:hypothetical protein